jgi:hypothetical protein
MPLCYSSYIFSHCFYQASADEVINKIIDAQGGKEKLLTIKT